MIRIFLMIALLWTATTAVAERRVALVVGNSDYVHAGRLANPQNDARAIGAKLTGLGFEVFVHENLSGQAFRIALGAFAEEALRSDLAVVFYAGHGIELSGRNYLIPVDAKMTSEATAQFEALSLDDVLSTVRNAGKLGLVMLDACRDNPFANTMERKNGTRAVSRGLAPVTLEGEAGTLVSFAAQAGDVAADGDGQNSPYTQALLQLMDEPGLEIGAMFQKVTKVVKDKTGGKQKPMFRIQPPEDLVYLVPRGIAVEPAPTTPVVAPTPPTKDPLVVYLNAVRTQQRAPLEDFITRYPNHSQTPNAKQLLLDIADREYWESVLRQNTRTGYNTYLRAFANGRFRAQAQAKIDALTPVVVPQPAPQPTPKPNVVVRPSGIRTSCPAFNGSYAVQNIRTNDTLFVRAGPGKGNRVIGELPYNANGVRLGNCTGGWCAITYGCIQGHSFGNYLGRSLGAQQPSAFAGIYRVVNHPLDQKLNVRAGPGTNYAVVAELPPQAGGITVSDCQIEKGYSRRWCAVQWRSISGWAYGRYLADRYGRNPMP